MLVAGGNAEISEHQHEDEHVVERERPLDDITGQEFQRRPARDHGTEARFAVPVQRDTEEHGQGRPNGGPDGGFAKSDGVRPAVEDAEVGCQQKDHEGRESRVEPPVGGKGEEAHPCFRFAMR